MKALSFRQPWAELVLQGRKTMDLRTYNTHYRGRIAIHASQTVASDKCWENDLNPDNLDTGGIVGTVELVDVVLLDEAAYKAHEAAHLGGRRWREGLYGWILAHAERLPMFMPARGRAKLFNVDLDVSVTRAEFASEDANSSSVLGAASEDTNSSSVLGAASEDTNSSSVLGGASKDTNSSSVLGGASKDVNSSSVSGAAFGKAVSSVSGIEAETANASSVSTTRKRSPRHQALYTAHLNGTTTEKPFALHVQPLIGATTDYALTLCQRVAERPEAEPRLETVVTISGDNLRSVADHVLDALRKADYRATDLSGARRKPFYLSEEVGVRLGLVLLAVKPLSKFRRVEEISYGIRQMPSEEAYYWYSKCTAAHTADRSQKALRVLLVAVRI